MVATDAPPGPPGPPRSKVAWGINFGGGIANFSPGKVPRGFGVGDTGAPVSRAGWPAEFAGAPSVIETRGRPKDNVALLAFFGVEALDELFDEELDCVRLFRLGDFNFITGLEQTPCLTTAAELLDAFSGLVISIGKVDSPTRFSLCLLGLPRLLFTGVDRMLQL